MLIQTRRHIAFQAFQHGRVIGIDFFKFFRILFDKFVVVEVELRLICKIHLPFLSEESAQAVLLQHSFRNVHFPIFFLRLLLCLLLSLLFDFLFRSLCQLVFRQEDKSLFFSSFLRILKPQAVIFSLLVLLLKRVRLIL